MDRKPDVDLGAVAALLRRVFRGSPRPTFERTADGVATQVYRVFRGTGTYYLRVAEEAHEDLGTDADLLQRLRGLGVSVAEVVHVEAFDADIGRSVLITTEVPGRSLAETTDPGEAALVAEAAGQDLALVNSIDVEGFGFIRRRGRGWPLRGEHRCYAAFLTSHLPGTWPGPLEQLFTSTSWTSSAACSTTSAPGHRRARPSRTGTST